ncbi:MAG: glycosyltransferase family 2 protein [Haloferula sp.]
MIASVLAITAMALLFCRLRKLPRLTTEIDRAAPSISIIIPARNEESNLQRLLPSINQQSLAACEVIVVDDHSEDRTAAVAESHQCRVIRGKDLPDGWFGKPWACQQGAEAATGELLFFLDADVELQPSALARLAATASASPSAVISVCPWHRIESPYEELSVFFNLLMVGGIGAFTYRADQAKGIGLFGQTLLIPRKLYHDIGGHESVKKTVLENLHLAGELEKRGIERLCYLGKGSISMRMFPEGFGELTASWKKGFSSGAGLTSTFAMTLCILWLIGLMALAMIALMLPLGGPAAIPWVLGCYLAVAITLIILFRQVGRFSCWSALLFPIPLFFYQGLFASALIHKKKGGTTQWKGRDVA